jgi:pimeloyl-ACP methyl ester carboxylesterase
MINYVETGSGPAVVLLHGGAMDLRMWDEQVPALAERHRVIRFDARGHGRSQTPTAPFRQCDDVAELLGELGVERATLIGLSMGAGAATDTALEYPHLVEKLVVMCAATNEPTFTDPWILDIQRQMVDAQKNLDAPRWIELFLRMGLIGPYREAADVDPAVLHKCREMITDTVRNHVRPDAVAPHHVQGSWERLGEIAVPCLAFLGTLDAPDHNAMVHRFAEATNGELIEIGGSAHMPNMERPAEVNQALLEFMTQ